MNQNKSNAHFSLTRWQIGLIGLGVSLILFTLLMDSLGLGSAGVSSGQRLLFGLGLGIVIIGGLGQKLVSVYQTFAVLLLNTLVFLLLIEVGAGFISWVISSEPPPAINARLDHPYYAEQDWSAQYWSEFNALTKYEYAPYVVWRRPPFQGELIQVDEQQHRITPNATCDDENAFTVFAFGGSTMWGTGAPDWGTIPAYLQTALADTHAEAVCVINFGQSAYVSDQGLLELILQLKAGARPDWVIFYDGVNDVYAAYQNGHARAHQNLQTLTEAFAGRDIPTWEEQLLDDLRQSTYTGRLIERTLGEKALSSDEALVTYATMNISAASLADDIVQNYQENMVLALELAQDYDFEVFFFWQPIIMIGEKPLGTTEQAIIADLDPDLIELYEATYPQLATLEAPQFHYLGGVFDGETQEVWFDLFHVTPVGNEIILQAMLETLP